MAVFDTDTDRLDNDNRRIMERISLENLAERNFKIVWMDFCIEDVLERSVPGFNPEGDLDYHREGAEARWYLSGGQRHHGGV